MSYQDCLGLKISSRKLCLRGYCTAKQIFKTYPSAYANGYAVSVCQGKKPDYTGKISIDASYVLKSRSNGQNDLKRWFKEKWVNVCKKGKGAGGYAPCGRKSNSTEKYPYCRPYVKFNSTNVKTVKQLSKKDIQSMCKTKKGPKRVYLSKSI
jgi:hypothetical protein